MKDKKMTDGQLTAVVLIGSGLGLVVTVMGLNLLWYYIYYNIIGGVVTDNALTINIPGLGG